jgi:hypothetical protein
MIKVGLFLTLMLFVITGVKAMSLLDKLSLDKKHDSHLKIIKISEKRLPLYKPNSKNWGNEISRAYFDDQGKLHWNASPINTIKSPCPPGSSEHGHQTLLLNPRVDAFGCHYVIDHAHNEIHNFLVGIAPTSEPTWQRELVFPSGQYKIVLYAKGASQQGIVLDNLTVLDPATGDIIKQPLLQNIKERPIALHSAPGATAYLPDRNGFLTYSSDVTLIKKEGGIYFIDGETGAKELWLPVKTTHRAPWNVMEMVPAPEGRYVYLAHDHGFRGPGKVSIAVFDTETRKIIYEERYDGAFPQVIAGQDGNFGFSYITNLTRVVIHYRITKPAELSLK